MRLARILMVIAFIAVTQAVRHPAAQRRADPIRGSWAASAAAGALRGTWTAEPVPNRPDAAQGTWSLIQANRIVASGTWSAAKAASGWNGTWQARVTSGGSPGQSLSGTWRATVAAKDAGMLMDLLKKTLIEQVSGTWARGAQSGGWSLRASK